MIGIENYHAFIMAVLLFQIYPGAGTMAILNATARGGVRGGLSAVFGTLSGDFIYMLSAVLGLSALFAAYPAMLLLAQWLGAAYLIWIGFTFLRNKDHEPSGMALEKNPWGYYRKALAVSLTNPKAIMFFMAFFPLFLGSDATPLTLGFLMAHVTAISFVYQSTLVLAGHAVMRRVAHFRFIRNTAARLAGLAIMGFGIKLILNRRS